MVSFKLVQSRYKKFVFLLLLSALSPLIISGIINIMIDPYGVFDFPEIKKINNIKPEKANSSRLYQVFDIRRKKPKIIFLGSSRVKTGLKEKHFGFDQKLSIYNAAFESANTYEIMRYLEYAIRQQPDLEQVIIGLDFFMFNKYFVNRETFSETRLEQKYPWQDVLNSSLSIDALTASKNTIVASVNNKPKNNSNDKKINRFKFWLNGFLAHKELYARYELSTERINNLKKIVDICNQNNIKLKIFISPTHATQYQAIAISGLWSTFEKWKREIVKITPIWDFATYNSITTEPISDAMINYIDNSHYSQHTGDLVLNRILSYKLETVPNDFGILITPENIDFYLAENNYNYKKWIQNNPEEVKLVNKQKAERN